MKFLTSSSSVSGRTVVLSIVLLFFSQVSTLQPRNRLSRRLAAITRFYKRLEDHEYPPNRISTEGVSSSPSPSSRSSGISLVEQVIKNKNKKEEKGSIEKILPGLSGLKANGATLRKVSNVHDLRTAILDEGLQLRQVELTQEFRELKAGDVLNHEVLKLISERFHSGSTPGNRSDNATLVSI
jgi:hypothetical protein